jgi:hypothetical protein
LSPLWDVTQGSTVASFSTLTRVIEFLDRARKVRANEKAP